MSLTSLPVIISIPKSTSNSTIRSINNINLVSRRIKLPEENHLPSIHDEFQRHSNPPTPPIIAVDGIHKNSDTNNTENNDSLLYLTKNSKKMDSYAQRHESQRKLRGSWWRQDTNRSEHINAVKLMLTQHKIDPLVALAAEDHSNEHSAQHSRNSLANSGRSSSASLSRQSQYPILKPIVHSPKPPTAKSNIPVLEMKHQHINRMEVPEIESGQQLPKEETDGTEMKNMQETINIPPLQTQPQSQINYDPRETGGKVKQLEPTCGSQQFRGSTPQIPAQKSNAHSPLESDTLEEVRILRMQLTDANEKLAKSEAKAKKLAQSRKILQECWLELLDASGSNPSYTSTDALSLQKYFIKHGMNQTLLAFSSECNAFNSAAQYIILKQFMDSRDFANAIVFVQATLRRECVNNSKLIPSFEDLVYILSKYLLIYTHQCGNIEVAEETLKKVVIPLVLKEQRRGGVRAEWFTTDLQLLQNLIYRAPSEDGPNMYRNFKWDTELAKFWESGKAASKAGQQRRSSKQSATPLFAFALSEHFLIDDQTLNDVPDLDVVFQSYDKMRVISNIIDQNKTQIEPLLNQKPFEVAVRTRSSVKQKQTIPKAVNNDLHYPQVPQQDKYVLEALDHQKNVVKPHPPEDIVNDNKRPAPGSSKSRRKHRVSNSDHSNVEKSSASSTFQLPFSQDVEILPPIASGPNNGQTETSNFALASLCGPSIGHMRALDVRDIPETGQVIAATTGCDDGSDKGISIWDIRNNNLITHLNNNTVKPVISVLFHPTYQELLLTADMEFDVKLWNWKENKPVRWWKKHHTRIIYQLAWIPGDDTRAASCSGDQTVKIWNIHSEKPSPSGSVHANEPITSFIFCGSSSDPSQQKLVISLSYSIRIYKLRTLGLVLVIPLPDLKLSKTPISFLNSHPHFDNFILVSTDNQLRLFDLNTQQFVKTYSARLIESGTRIKGYISPHGMYVYATGYDTRNAMSRVPTSRKSNNSDDSLNTNDERFANGVFIWRLHSGKLEQVEMNAMDSTENWQQGNVAVKPCPTMTCKWLMIRDYSKKNKHVERKALVTTGTDKLLKMFL